VRCIHLDKEVVHRCVFREHSKEPSGVMTCWEFLECLREF
jgi:hypothetical protein